MSTITYAGAIQQKPKAVFKFRIVDNKENKTKWCKTRTDAYNEYKKIRKTQTKAEKLHRGHSAGILQQNKKESGTA